MRDDFAGLAQLISGARARGSITAGEVARALGHLDLSPSQVRELYRRIAEAGVEIVETELEASDDIHTLTPEQNPGTLAGDFLRRVNREPPISQEQENYLWASSRPVAGRNRRWRTSRVSIRGPW